jgi:hypothetical protein
MTDDLTPEELLQVLEAMEAHKKAWQSLSDVYDGPPKGRAKFIVTGMEIFENDGLFA